MTSPPIIAAKSTITLARESQYGVSPGDGTAVCAYPGSGALLGWDATQTESGGGGRTYGRALTRQALMQMQVPAFRSYLYENPADQVDFWTLLLEASGFQRLTDESPPGHQTWGAVSGVHTSASIGWWVKGLHHEATGVRGALTLTMNAGAPVEWGFAGTGRVVESRPTSGFPVQAVSGRVMQTCNLGVVLVPTEGAPIRPKGETVEIQTNTQLVSVRKGNRDQAAVEWRVAGVDPTIRMTIEANAAKDWWKDRELAYRITGGVGEIRRWEWDAPRMTLKEPPEWVTLNSGLLGVGLVFRHAGGPVPLKIARTM